MPEINRPPNLLPPHRSHARQSAKRQNETIEAINRTNTGVAPPFGVYLESYPVQSTLANITITIDGGGAAITTSSPTMGGATVEVPCACQIVNWTVESDASGSIAVDVTRANKAVPSSSIVGSGNKPALSTHQYASAAPSGWTSVQLAQGDIIGFSVASATTVQRVTVTLRVAY